MFWIFNDNIKLYTQRLVMRRFKRRDYKDLYRYLSLPEVVRYEPYEVFSLNDAKIEAKCRARHPAFWAVCLRETGQMIGNMYFPQITQDEYRSWEIGYVIHPDYHGMGYATEASKKLLDYGFITKKAHRICAKCDPLNTASWKLLERLGMRREGHAIKDAWFKRDEFGEPVWHDTFNYAILEEEWFRQNSAQQPGD